MKHVELNWDINEICFYSDDKLSNHAFGCDAAYCQPEKLEVCLTLKEAEDLIKQLQERVIAWKEIDADLEELNNRQCDNGPCDPEVLVNADDIPF